MIDRNRLADLLASERAQFASRNTRSRTAYERATHLFGRVPMTWMNKRAGDFPLYLATARDACVTDLDGHSYVDLCLGDTGAMAGHSPDPVVEAVRRRTEVDGGLTTMMPTEDAEWVGAELARRFGLPAWSFALTGTDANRWAMRLARALTNRPKVLFHSYCNHGSVDESSATSRVAEINDLPGLERELALGDTAAVLIEPALTNIGIVLPEPGYLEGVRELTRRYGTLLIHDETHTFSAGPGGVTGRDGLHPDVVTIGKAIAGGVPCAAYGLSAELADRLLGRDDLDLVDTGGVGGTLAGNPVSMAAARACLGEVLTEVSFLHMIGLTTRLAGRLRSAISQAGLPWSVSQLGARLEVRFADPAPRTGTESHAAEDGELDDYLHVFCANRGVLLTPFHNMALTCPASTPSDVEVYAEVFADALATLVMA